MRMKLRVSQILSARRSMFNPFSADMGTKSLPICFFAAARYCSFTRSTLFRTTSEGTYLRSPVKTSINCSSVTSSLTKMPPLLIPYASTIPLTVAGESLSSLIASRDNHIRGFLVDPNPHSMKLMLQHLYLSWLKHVQDQ